jgi:hypothetical protein
LAIDKSAISEGYIFVTPKTPEKSNFTWSSYIYNNEGVGLLAVRVIVGLTGLEPRMEWTQIQPASDSDDGV